MPISDSRGSMKKNCPRVVLRVVKDNNGLAQTLLTADGKDSGQWLKKRNKGKTVKQSEPASPMRMRMRMRGIRI